MQTVTLTRVVAAMIAVLIFSICAMAQAPASGDMVITNSHSMNGTGTITIKGHIIDTNYAKTITGKVILAGSGHQNIGRNATGSALLTFDTLVTNNSGFTDTMKVPVQVRGHLNLNNGTLLVNNKTLEIDSLTTKGSGSLSAASAGDSVLYNAVGTNNFTQTVIASTYKRLGLRNSSRKTLGGAVITDTVRHSGGGLTVNNGLTINSHALLDSLIDVTGSNTVSLNGATIDTITNVFNITSSTASVTTASTNALSISTISNNSGTISTGAAALGITNLNANAGTIRTTGAGAITFTNGATNSGTITNSAGTGGINFNAALGNNAAGQVVVGAGNLVATGTVTNAGTIRSNSGAAGTLAFNNATAIINTGTVIDSGNGAATYAGTVTNTSGSIGAISATQNFQNTVANAAGATVTTKSGSMAFTGAITNAGTLSITSPGGSATINSNFAAQTGTLAFDSLSTVTYQGTTSVVQKARYGSLTLDGTSTKTSTGSDTVRGTLSLKKSIAMGTDTMYITSPIAQAITDTGEVNGRVRRNIGSAAADTLYAFNRSDVGVAFKTGGVEDYTINMTPATQPTTLASGRYMNRQYLVNRNAGTDSLSKTQLYYAETERVSIDTSKLGVQYKSGSSWTKIAAAGYTHRRSNSTAGGNIYVSGAHFPNTFTELGIFQSGLQTVAAGSYANASIWDESRVPDSTDDAEVRHAVTLATNGYAGTLLVDQNGTTGTIDVQAGGLLYVKTSVDVNSPSSVTLSAATSKLTLGPNGTYFNNSGTLTLSNATAALNIWGGYFRQNGTLSNSGLINIGQ